MDTLPKKDHIGVVLRLPVQYMDMLTKSTSISARSKSKEASLRLIDHLMRYKHITKIGQATCREENIDE